MPRKRFNAFEDFPANQDEKTKKSPDTIAEPQIASMPFAMPKSLYKKGDQVTQDDAAKVERIERLRPSQMIPDRFQPRRLLPTELRVAFFNGTIDCYQAARQWLQMARNDAGIQKEVDRLMAMGTSFEEHGQIKPITGSWVAGPRGDFVFQIETGERRFWAACLQYAAQKQREEPQLRVEVIDRPTRTRQVLENRHAEQPSAVGQACEVASLILAELGEQPDPRLQNEFEYFRRWHDKRMPAGMWEKITPVMQLTRERMVQLLNLLNLPNELLDQADRYRLPERVLREVLRSPKNEWPRLIASAIQHDWTSDDVAVSTGREEARSGAAKGDKKSATPRDPVEQAINAMKRFANALDQMDEDMLSAVLDDLANDMVVNNQAEEMIQILRNLSERIRIREANRRRR